MRFLLTLYVFLQTTSTFGFEIHSKHCLYGCPKGSPSSNDLIIRDIYIASSNDMTKFFDWTAYVVDKKNFGPSRSRNWKPDPLLSPNETLERSDYDKANEVLKTDRGHQVPLASFAGHLDWKDTNFLSNITPQKSSLNQGSWKRLEERIRRLASSLNKQFYVMTGPLFEANLGQLPNADEVHIVPSGYWKIVSIDSDRPQGVEVISFVFPQEAKRSDKFCSFSQNISNIERRSNLSFFHRLEKRPIESKFLLEKFCPDASAKK